LWFPLRWLFLVWLLDGVYLASQADAGQTDTSLIALGTAAALSVCVGIVAGVVLAGLVWLSMRGQAQRLRPMAWLRTGDADQQSQKGAALLATGLLGAGLLAAAFMVSQMLILGMAKPHLTALAIIAAHSCLAGIALAAWPGVHAGLFLLARRLRNWPAVGAVFGRAPVMAWTVTIGGTVALAVIVWIMRKPLWFLPWPEILQGLAALAGAALWIPVRRRLPKPRVPVRAAILAPSLFVVAVAALGMLPGSATSLKFTGEELLSGTLTLPPVASLLDVDGDQHASFLGAGDCEPFNELVHPGAIDVPENGRDEDCNGRDLDGAGLPKPGPYNHPVPPSLTPRPHIILISVDAFAARRLEALGGTKGRTPNMDALVARSAIFRHCFSQGPSTRLSFPSMFTSRWDSQIRRGLRGKHPYAIDKAELMLAEVLRNAGYDTAAVVSNKYFSKRRWRGITSGFGRVVESPFTMKPKVRHNSARVTDESLRIVNRTRIKPLFLWAHYYDAHSPFKQPHDIPRFGKTRRDIYDAELMLVDREIGRLLEGIDKRMGGDTVVILTADHGIAFDKQRHAKKHYGHDLHTVTLHVPLIFNARAIAPRVDDSLVSTMDIAPTIINLLRIKRDFPYEGESLVANLFGQATPTDRPLVHQFFLNERLYKKEDPLPVTSLRTSELNLIHDRKHDTFEMYAWTRDYGELFDLSDVPEWRSRFERLKDQLAVATYRLHGKRFLAARAKWRKKDEEASKRKAKGKKKAKGNKKGKKKRPKSGQKKSGQRKSDAKKKAQKPAR